MNFFEAVAIAISVACTNPEQPMFRQKGILQPTSNGESKHKNPHRWIEEDVLLGLVTALLSLAPVTGPLADLARTLTCYLQIIKIV